MTLSSTTAFVTYIFLFLYSRSILPLQSEITSLYAGLIISPLVDSYISLFFTYPYTILESIVPRTTIFYFFLEETTRLSDVSRFKIVILAANFDCDAADHTKHFAFSNITKLSLTAFSVNISYLLDEMLYA